MVVVASAASRSGASMTIEGRLNTANIEQGFRRVRSGFDGVKGQSRSFEADLTRMGQAASGLARTFAGLAVAGGTAMVALASTAPAVAPALARIQAEFGKLSRSLGESLAPAFERASELFSRFVSWVDSHSPTINQFAITMSDQFLNVVDGAIHLWNSLSGSVRDLSANVGIHIDVTGNDVWNYMTRTWGVPVALSVLTQMISRGRVGAAPVALGTHSLQTVGEFASGDIGAGEAMGSVGGGIGGFLLGRLATGAAMARLGFMAPLPPQFRAALALFGGVAGAVGGEALFSAGGRRLDEAFSSVNDALVSNEAVLINHSNSEMDRRYLILYNNTPVD